MRQLFGELKRRNVYRVAVTYVVAAFVVLQLADLAAGAFDFPGWFEPMIWVVAGLGFPVALVVAWAFELTPEGVKRTPASQEPVELASADPAAGNLPGWIVVLGIAALAGRFGGAGTHFSYPSGGGSRPSGRSHGSSSSSAGSKRGWRPSASRSAGWTSSSTRRGRSRTRRGRVENQHVSK